MGNNLYAFVKPEKHYSLLHGDYVPSNVTIDQIEKNIKVFDWGTFTTGPHFLDIAKYFAETITPYKKVQNLYLYDKNFGKNFH